MTEADYIESFKKLKLFHSSDKLSSEELIRQSLLKLKQSEELKPFQAELIKLQSHIEKTGHKIIILFDGRDASGKGGTIRRVTRYMNEKRYRLVALGKPTDTPADRIVYETVYRTISPMPVKSFCLTAAGITELWWNLCLDFVRRISTKIL